MRILMVSPHPTYSPRGTPIAVLNRCRALCALGHEVDLVTYGIGTDVPVEGLRYLRAPVPGIRTVKVGPSLAKGPLDLAVFLKALRRMWRGRRRYDVLHTHEEAGLLGLAGRRSQRLPHVYDMGNDLAVVLTNYGLGERHPVTRAAAAVESAMIRSSAAVIAHFPSIGERVAAASGDAGRAVVVPNIPVEPPPDAGLTARVRAGWTPDGLPVVLYTGTLEAYQGLPPLLDAVAALREAGTPVRLVVVGGRAEQRERLRAQADGLDLGDLVRLEDARPQEQIPSCLAAADVLASPRAGGSNTPLKLFSYLGSGRPVVATRIESHTQVIDDRHAFLVEPDAAGLAAGIAAALADPDDAAARAAAARALVDARFGVREFVRGAALAYRAVGGPAVDDAGLDAAVAALLRQLAPAVPPAVPREPAAGPGLDAEPAATVQGLDVEPAAEPVPAPDGLLEREASR